MSDARRIACGEARLFPVVLDGAGPPDLPDRPPDPPPSPIPDLPPGLQRIFATARPIAAYGTSHRLFTEGQRLAMIARDKGCTFPGCTAPVLWCEADHVTDWTDTGRTSVDDGHLACPRHHRDKDRNGWTVTMHSGLPHWTAPAWLDPDRTPQRNRAHDPVLVS